MLFSNKTLFDNSDGELQAELNEAVQVKICKCVAALEFLTRGFDQVSRLLKIAKTAEAVNVKKFLTTVIIKLGEHME